MMIVIDNVENLRKYMGKVYIDLTNRFINFLHILITAEFQFLILLKWK